jgi:palmitoyltransferase
MATIKYHNAKIRLLTKFIFVFVHLAVGGGLAIYSAWREVPVVTALFFITAFITFILHHLASVDPGFLEVNESDQSGLLNSRNRDDPSTRHCDVCNIDQPVRTKHCSTCNRCVDRYDHHCSFIGVCVGAKNNHMFWIYLVVQTICVIFVQMMNIPNFHRPPQESTKNWFWYNLPFLYLSFILFGIFLLPSLMLFYHTFLMLTNSTTWEQTRRRQITYLKDLPRDLNPFDLGWVNNVKQFFTVMPYQRINWSVEASTVAKEQ